jgi:membrane-associated phospholipid phosphatase
MAVAASRPRSEIVQVEEKSGKPLDPTPRQSRLKGFLQEWSGFAAYIAVLSVWITSKGVPLTRGAVALWLMAGMLAFSLRDLRRWVTSVALEWFPFIAFLFAYDTARSFAHRLFATNVRLPLEGDRLLFGGVDPTVWLQRHLWHGANSVRWYDYACWGVYMTFFFATLAVAAGLWIFAYHRFRRYVAMVGLLSLMGLITYVLFPAAPPWYASEHGLLPPIQRLTGVVWSHSFVSISQVVDHGQGLSNPVAAMPSLHAAFTLLVALFLWRSARWWWRIPLALYPLAMGFTLMYFGEHYAVDVLAGWVYAILAYRAVEWFCARKAERSSSATAPSAAPARLVPAMKAAKRPD